MNRKSWDSLDDNAKKIVADAATVVINKQFDEGKATDEEWRKKAIDGGMKFVELTPAEFAAAVEAVRGKVWPEMEEKAGKFLMDQIRSKASAPPK
jgi:TRAP-type C4-dicarboxylate transport system substrate-binding protein